jgi:hypothetical protein
MNWFLISNFSKITIKNSEKILILFTEIQKKVKTRTKI